MNRYVIALVGMALLVAAASAAPAKEAEPEEDKSPLPTGGLLDAFRSVGKLSAPGIYLASEHWNVLYRDGKKGEQCGIYALRCGSQFQRVADGFPLSFNNAASRLQTFAEGSGDSVGKSASDAFQFTRQLFKPLRNEDVQPPSTDS